MTNDSLFSYPYPSQRMPVLADNVLATSHPLAAQAGLDMYKEGGNAVDAALAAAIALTVLEPVSNGLGSDAFALIWDGQRLTGLNGSGRSPEGWSLDRFQGMQAMPSLGWDAVTVPGAVHAWSTLSQELGRVPFDRLFAPAIAYAREGFLLSPITAHRWQELAVDYAHFPEFAQAFLPGGRAPHPGERFICPGQAASLQDIAQTHGRSLYQGALAERIAAQAQAQGGCLTLQDLSRHSSTWVEPIQIDFQDWQVHEIPPNGQGLAALIALGLLTILNLKRYALDSVQAVHLQVEAMKAAFAQVHAQVADPVAMRCSASELLQSDFLQGLAETISMDRAGQYPPLPPNPGGTVYLTAADRQGMMVSFIQSNYTGFGSGVVIADTGISLQNRGSGFVLDPDHPNCVHGGKRPFHTIIPSFVTCKGQPVLSFGVMGAHMQPQGHVQVITRMRLWGQNAQAALDAPRWQVYPDGSLALEAGLAKRVQEGLQLLGHTVIPDPPMSLFGGGQIIHHLQSGGYLAASDPRKDGQALGW